MEKKKINYFKNILLKMKNDLQNEIDSFANEEGQSLKDSSSELSSYDNHPADQGSETYEREKDMGLRDNTLSLLKQVDSSLEKIESGNFGICKECGKKIDIERLKVIPYTDLCRECSKNTALYQGRPVEEDLLKKNLRQHFHDEYDYNVENAWQDVSRYGTSDNEQ